MGNKDQNNLAAEMQNAVGSDEIAWGLGNPPRFFPSVAFPVRLAGKTFLQGGE